jgi:hypothetical protein
MILGARVTQAVCDVLVVRVVSIWARTTYSGLGWRQRPGAWQRGNGATGRAEERVGWKARRQRVRGMIINTEQSHTPVSFQVPPSFSDAGPAAPARLGSVWFS